MSLSLSGQPRLVTVFGGNGFVGRHTVRALAQAGWRVRVACRRPDLAIHLQPLGRVGQISAVQANLRYPDSVLAAASGADAIINLVAIASPKGRQNFEAVHVFGARAVARAAKEAGAKRLVHISAIGADASSDSNYSSSKGRGEEAVKETFPEAILVRPSLIFGPEDDFLNRFAAIIRLSPVMPLFGGGQAKFQPVYVGDVATAITRLCGESTAATGAYELGGPNVKTFEQLMRYICEVTGRQRLLVPVPLPVAHVQAFALEWLNRLSLGIWPDWLTVTRDQVKLLQKANVVSDAALAGQRTLQGLDITPESMEIIAPSYLYRFRKTGQFEARGTA